jgi:hypothetical protein
MSALTADVQVNRKDGDIIAHKCAVDTIYEGGLVKLNAAGFAAPCAAEVGAVFAGVAVEQVANESPYSAGDQSVRVYKKGLFLLTGSGFAQTDVGQPVFATDDQTITKTNAADKQLVGIIAEYYSSTQVWVKIDSATVQPLLGAHIPDAAVDAASAIATVNLVLAVLRKAKMISES